MPLPPKADGFCGGRLDRYVFSIVLVTLARPLRRLHLPLVARLGFRRFPVVFLLGCFLARRLSQPPEGSARLGAPGTQPPVIGADFNALGVHPLPVPVCAKGAGMLLGFLGAAKPLHRNERRRPE